MGGVVRLCWTLPAVSSFALLNGTLLLCPPPSAVPPFLPVQVTTLPPRAPAARPTPWEQGSRCLPTLW